MPLRFTIAEAYLEIATRMYGPSPQTTERLTRHQEIWSAYKRGGSDAASCGRGSAAPAGCIQKDVLGMARLGVRTARPGGMVWSSRMTARGVDFLENWIAKNISALHPSDDPLRAYNLAARCIAEAAAEGITLEEINTATDSLETRIFDAMAHLAAPGTPGD